uniref:Neural proliferation differentiation and control protein 1 n=1 Tax=Macrostomum lignano TaxID=282301 RepID=A0A1I8JMQ2_9PLAT
MCCVSTLMLALGIATLKHLRSRRQLQSQKRELMEEERRLNRVSQDPIEAAAFVKEHRRRTRNKELQYEYKAIEQISVGEKQSASIRSEGQHKVAEAAKLPCNKEKNLSERVLPC